MTSVAATTAEVLRGLDEDLLEYISGAVADEGDLLPKEDLLELVVPMLEEFCSGDEEKATALASELWTRLSGGAAEVEDTSAPRALATAVRMDDIADPTVAAVAPTTVDVKNLHLSDVNDSKSKASISKKKTAAKEAKEKAAMLETMTSQVHELDAELQAARERAVRLQAAEGAGHMGSLQIGPFQLPNPGGGLDLLDDASCILVPGRRYGLLGRNGKGKSTMLRYLAARRVGGLPDIVSIYYVTQTVSLTQEQEESTPLEVVMATDIERRMLLEEAAALKDGTSPEDQARAAEVDARLVAIEAHTAEQRTDALLKNLGFSQQLRSRQMKNLSGGWRVRTMLAAALYSKPDVLLLDEPTNHLSIDAVLWLSNHLATDPAWDNRIVVVVSHDRVFIDDCCTDVLHISGVARRLTQSRGNYSTWAKRRADQQKAKKKQFELRETKRDKLAAYTQHGFKYGGSSGQIAMQQKMVKQLDKLDQETEAETEELAALEEDEELPLSLQAGGLLDKPVAQLKEVGFGYKGGELLFKGVEFSIDTNSRICLLGENGAGKTTLVKIVTGELEPTAGEVLRASGARIEVVNQHHGDQIDFDMTPLQFMISKFPGNGSYDHEQKLRGHLAGCGLSAVLQGTMIRGLSGGQRSRVAMAAVSFAAPHLLIMDEPTNNLDLEAVEALANCVEEFQGGVILVSHDQYFVSRVAKDIMAVANGMTKTVKSFEAYKKNIVEKLSK
ncbi:hypothetical protein CYMTET_6805 [Cymbomonas tetramitiformis]|uniref:ABC transporter domain-containing protein n=1 Tax=Cymbomonas tetramitiformis TaxID=36881 RepID=A0AAE0GWV9_9CHLO|nr:hypothetical protein CYMTET_6805 [Cymbomonas tetramitiformis]